MKTIEEFFGKKPIVPAVNIPDAETHIRKGLEYFCGKDYSWLPVYNDVVSWATDNKGKGLFLLGDCGTGKTLLTSHILMPLINHYWQKEHLGDSKYWLVRFAALDMKSASEYNGNIIVDDVGIEDMSNAFGERIDYFARLMDRAEYEGRMVICTSNLTPDELKTKYGMRVWDRIIAMTTPLVFNTHGKSLRK